MAANNPGTSPASDSSDREILVTRLFDAPRELVFEAWTNLKHIPHWWGPKGFATAVHEMDVRPGGVWRLTMRGPDGREYKNWIVFVEVAKPERLVYKHEPEPRQRAGEFPNHGHFCRTRRPNRSHSPYALPIGSGARSRGQGLRRHRGPESDPRTPGGPSRRHGSRRERGLVARVEKGAGTRHHPHLRRAPAVGVRSLEQARKPGALVGTEGIHPAEM